MAIKLRIDAPTIPSGASFTHASTSWQLNDSIDFSVPANLLYESLEDTVNLLNLDVELNVPPEQLVYARVKIHFSDGTTSEWSRIISLSECMKGFKLSDTIVVSPKLYVNGSPTDIPYQELEVTTDPFTLYAGVGVHKSTTWEVTTLTGELLWSRIKDEDNLTSIRLPSHIFRDNAAYVIKATHSTNTNADSLPGRVTVATGLPVLQNLYNYQGL